MTTSTTITKTIIQTMTTTLTAKAAIVAAPATSALLLPAIHLN